MRIRYMIMLAGLAVAFTAASLWVFLSGGRNAKAIRAKFRVGGLMLTVSSMLAISSCEGGEGGIFSPTCYDPVPPEYIEYTMSWDESSLHVGDVIEFKLIGYAATAVSYRIASYDGKVIQSGNVEITDSVGTITISETEYRGLIHLEIFDESGFLSQRSFTLE